MRQRMTPAFHLVLIVALATVTWVQASPLENGNTPTVSLGSVYCSPSQYVGDPAAIRFLESGEAKSVSLAHADLDGDGIDDLVIGYATPGGGGILSLTFGNAEAFVSQSDNSGKISADKQFVSPFVNTSSVFLTPIVPSFLATGEFLGQGDVVTATEGGNAFNIYAGKGRGDFSAPESFAVPGPIEAMISGRFGNDIRTNSLLIGISGPEPAVLLYQGSRAGISLVGRYPVRAPARSFDFDDLDGDGRPDAVMVSGGNVLILHATGPSESPLLETLSLPFSAVSVVAGFFTHDRAWRRQMAVLDSSGTIHIVVHGDFDARPWSGVEIRAMRDALTHQQPNPFQSTQVWPANDGWNVLESFSGTAPFGAASQIPLLLRTSFLRNGLDEVLAINSEAGQASFISHAGLQTGAATFPPGRQFLLSVSSSPTAAVVMPISAGQPGLVSLNQNLATPLIVTPVTTVVFTVNNITTDTPDQNAGDGICADVNNLCSLRAAVMEVDAEAANGIAGPFKINLPAGNIQLTIPGASTTNASTGHLDVNAPVTIVGQGVSKTMITQTNPNGDQDMVFLIDSVEEGTQSYGVAIDALTITGGHANSMNLLFTSGGGIHWEAGSEGTGQLMLYNVAIESNFATDPKNPGLDDGGGLALFNMAAVSHPAYVGISGLSASIENNIALDVGGGIALKGAVGLQLIGATVAGNQAVGGGFQQGGGIYISASGAFLSNGTTSPSLIQGSTISANTAGTGTLGEGGGIWTDQSLTINQGSTVIGNTGGGSGGGILTNLQRSTDSVVVTASTISGNSTPGGNGGGIEIDNASLANLQLSFNRIFGNTVGTTGMGNGLSNEGSGTLTAADNWWGCNGGPQALGDGCDQIAGAATASPSVELAFSANPNTVLDLANTTLTASFQDSNPNFTANLNALVGLPVHFTNAVNGTLSNEAVATGTSATATATFTPNASPTASASVEIDGATVPVFPTIEVSDFSITGSPTPQTINIGTASAAFNIAVGAINGFSNAVSLVVSNSSGLSANLSSSSVTGSGTVTLTVQTASTVAGTYPITITGSSGSISHQVTVQLTIADFAVSITPATQTVSFGANPSYTISVSSSTGFSGLLSLTFSGAPSGSSLTLTTLNLPNGPISSSLITHTPPAGTYTINVTTTDSTGVMRSTSAQLVVNPPPPPPPPNISAPNIALSVYIHPGPAGSTVISGNTTYESIQNNSSYPVSIVMRSSSQSFSGGSCVAPAGSYCSIDVEFYATKGTGSGTYTATYTITGTAQAPGSGTTSITVSATAAVNNACDGQCH